MLDMPQIRLNRGLLTALAERWHSDHNTFHLHTGEMTVMLEDVWHILLIPFVGEIVVHDLEEQGGIESIWRVFQDPHIVGVWIPWVEMYHSYAPLPSVLAGFIGGFLCPDKRSKGLSLGWGQVLEGMMVHRMRYAWGMCMLVQLYHDLHWIVYLGGSSLSAGATLLQVWAWEHIAIMRLELVLSRPATRPYVFRYRGRPTQHMMGKLDYWRWVLDDVETVTWRPYLDCDDWDEDDIELGYLVNLMYLIRKSSKILERFLFPRIYRQYGIVQCMPQGVAHYG